MISLLIPSTTKNKTYAEYLRENIRSLYSERSDIEILISVDDSLTLSEHYNKLVKIAKGDIVVLLHDDMVLHNNFIEQIERNIKPKRILTYTRVEPPIYNDQYPGKVISDFGTSIDNFKEELFQKMNLPDELIDGGSQLFFACYKEDYIGLDEKTYKLFCEDDDLHLRYNLLGYEKKVCPAMVYHFVSKTSRTGNYREVETASNRNFIRKWSFRNSIHNKKINTIIKVKNCSAEALSYLEPFSFKIYVDLPEVIIDSYVKTEQLTTKFNLEDRVYKYDSEIETDGTNCIVEFDFNDASNETFSILPKLSDIIIETNEVGEYEIDCIKIKILSTTPQDVPCHL